MTTISKVNLKKRITPFGPLMFHWYLANYIVEQPTWIGVYGIHWTVSTDINICMMSSDVGYIPLKDKGKSQ